MVAIFFSIGSKAGFLVTGVLGNGKIQLRKLKQKCTNLPFLASKQFCLLVRFVELFQTFMWKNRFPFVGFAAGIVKCHVDPRSRHKPSLGKSHTSTTQYLLGWGCVWSQEISLQGTLKFISSLRIITSLTKVEFCLLIWQMLLYELHESFYWTQEKGMRWNQQPPA